MVKVLTDSSFNDEVKNNRLAFVDFYADWCMPCKMMAPVIDDLSEEISKVSFFKINVDSSSKTAKEFSVMSIPTMILFKDGKAVEKIVGVLSSDALKEKISKHID